MVKITDYDHPDLIALWTGDSVTGSVVNDEAGNYPATIEGGITFPASLVGNGIRFDGDAGALRLGTIPVDDPLQLLGDFAISFIATPDGNGDFYQRILDKSDGGNGANGWGILINYEATTPSSAVVKFAMLGTAYQVSASLLEPSVSTVCILSCESNEIKFYKGETLEKVTPIPARVNVETNATIGTWNHSTEREYKGVLDQLRVFGRAVTLDEAKTLTEEPQPYEITGVVATDYTPSVNEIRIYNAATGELLNTTSSSVAGSYQQSLLNNDPVYVMAVPDAGYQPLVHGPINPSLK